MSAAKPEAPSNAAGSHTGIGRLTASARPRADAERRADIFLDGAVAADGTTAELRFAISHAPAAAMRFKAMATNVVARRPIAEIRTNPVTSAPTAAPTVF